MGSITKQQQQQQQGYVEPGSLERGDNMKGPLMNKENHHHQHHHHHHGFRSAHNMSTTSLRKKSDLSLVSKLKWGFLRNFLANLQQVFLGTKLAILIPAIPLAIFAFYYHFGSAWVFALSLLGLIPLAERADSILHGSNRYVPCHRQNDFLHFKEVGGLLNATCGNATELIIALLALKQQKITVLKCSLVGSVLSNLLLVLGSSLFCGGLFNIRKEQKFERKQADVNSVLLILGLLCLMLPMTFRYYAVASGIQAIQPTLQLSRVCSIVMLLAYVGFLFFQLKTHRQIFEAQEEVDDDDDVVSDEEPVIGFPSAIVWLLGMTAVIALLSEYVVGTIEAASDYWGVSVGFNSIILLPIVGNAAEHAGAIIFAFKNKLDITLGVSLGSATQVSMFVIPITVIVAWIMGIPMDLDFKLLETASLFVAVLVTAFTLQIKQMTLTWVSIHLLKE
ncbi:Vacuolar cation/proton exchanger 1a [Acorus gramineus]|uniref:Vacuolar cation/proton exchanger n=1 Tax=Acorus gramineus TaxID=55184 RepID=A0AAV9ALH7_ACOGR|nr:Vacuolar cation/proton exchanger 1a [Acorus gramineus]